VIFDVLVRAIVKISFVLYVTPYILVQVDHICPVVAGSGFP